MAGGRGCAWGQMGMRAWVRGLDWDEVGHVGTVVVREGRESGTVARWHGGGTRCKPGRAGHPHRDLERGVVGLVGEVGEGALARFDFGPEPPDHVGGDRLGEVGAWKSSTASDGEHLSVTAQSQHSHSHRG